MNFKVKMALLAVTTIGIAMQSGACLARFFGDVLGDTLWLRGID